MAATQLFVFYFAVTRLVLLLQKTTCCYYSRVVSNSLALPRVQLQFEGETIQEDAHCLINEMQCSVNETSRLQCFCIVFSIFPSQPLQHLIY